MIGWLVVFAGWTMMLISNPVITSWTGLDLSAWWQTGVTCVLFGLMMRVSKGEK